MELKEFLKKKMELKELRNIRGDWLHVNRVTLATQKKKIIILYN